MGSFNSTCGVSNLPIHSGNPVMVLLLSRHKFWSPEKPNNMAIRNNDYYEVFGFPFSAEYNDYGWVNNEEQSIYVDWTLKQLDNQLIEREVGANKYHDPAVKRGEITIDRLGYWLTDDRLRITNPTAKSLNLSREDREDPIPEYRPVGFMFVHKKIYDDLANYVNYKFYDYEGKGNVHFNLDYYVQGLKSEAFSYKSKWNKYKDLEGANDELMSAINNIDDYEFRQILRHKFTTSEFIINIRKNYSDIDLDELANRLATFAMFDFAFDRLYKFYHPQRSGSQEDAGPGYKVLMKSMRELLVKRKKEMEE